MKPLYKRILLKLSGEGLMGDKAFGMDDGVIRSLAVQIREVRGLGVEVCLVVGGGNIFRGAKEASKGLDRSVADQVGMLATVMNALYLQNALEKLGIEARVLSGLSIPKFARTTFTAGTAPFAKNRGADLCRRHRLSLFYHRHRRRPSRFRDEMRRAAEGDPGGRRL